MGFKGYRFLSCSLLILIFQANAISAGEGTETQFRFNCASMTAALSTLSPTKAVSKPTLEVIVSVAKNGLKRPSNRLMLLAWENFQWPKIFAALEAFDLAARNGDVRITEYIEWVAAEKGSNPEARELRTLQRTIIQLTAMIKGGDGVVGLEAQELELGLKIHQAQARSSQVADIKPTADHQRAKESVDKLTKELRTLSSTMDEIDRAIQRLQKPTASTQSKISTAPKAEVDPKIEEKRLQDLAAAQERRASVEAERSRVQSELNEASGRLKVFDDNLSAAKTSVSAAAEQRIAEQRKVSEELEQRQRQLLKATASYDSKSRDYAIRALYQSWGVWDAYQAEIKKRSDAKAAEDEAARVKAEAARKLAEAKQAAALEKQRANEFIERARLAAAEAEKKLKGTAETSEPNKGDTKTGADVDMSQVGKRR